MRTSVSLNDPLIQAEFNPWPAVMAGMIEPKNLIVVAGRGMTKTTIILAKRFQTVSHDMHHAYFAWTADTYMNAFDNVIPTLLEGIERYGWRDSVHYVVDKAPPKNWKRPYKPVQSYKHTISTYWGTFTKIGSLDQPSSLAGNSYQHLFGDEVKNQNESKLKKLTPALRGGTGDFMKSIFYRGRSFTTDMPNVTEKEYNWVLNYEKQMDIKQIRMVVAMFEKINRSRSEQLKAVKNQNVAAYNRATKRLIKEYTLYNRLRKDSTLFLMASSFANTAILSPGWFKEQLDEFGAEPFRTSILTLPPTLVKGARFYANLGPHHYYDDGVRNSFYDKYSLLDSVKPTSEALRYVLHNQKLEIGVDFGDMTSIVVGQQNQNYYYIVKNFYTLAKPISVIAKDFREFFRNHKYKYVDVYYDRAGNQNEKTQRDWAGDLQKAIEYENGVRTGWTVNLKSRRQGNIEQSDEYRFMQKYLSGEMQDVMPDLRIDKHQCRELKSSLELTKIKISKDKHGSNVIKKDKSSESLPLEQRPMYSTNFSDAFKYLMMRRENFELSQNYTSSSTMLDVETI